MTVLYASHLQNLYFDRENYYQVYRRVLRETNFSRGGCLRER